eukprot:gene13448-13574_t
MFNPLNPDNLIDHQRLGQAGDIIKVKAGHARYILFPRGEADYAVPSVLRQLKERGLLTPATLEMMANGFKEQQGAAAGALDLSTLPVEQQLPRIVQLLSDSTVTISQRYNLHQADQPMLGQVTARQLSAYVAQQLKVLLPEELIMMHKHDPITQFGAYKVPLNLKDADGNQAQLKPLIFSSEAGLASSQGQRRQALLFVAVAGGQSGMYGINPLGF